MNKWITTYLLLSAVVIGFGVNVRLHQQEIILCKAGQLVNEGSTTLLGHLGTTLQPNCTAHINATINIMEVLPPKVNNAMMFPPSDRRSVFNQ